jgi:hypothetical protein
MNAIKRMIQNMIIKQYFGFILLLYILINIILSWYIISDELYYQSFDEQLRTDLISKIINFKNKWDWIGFLVTPLLIFLKVLFVAACLAVGNFVLDLKLKFKQLFRIAILAETIFLVASFVRIVWFLLFPDNLSLEYIQSFYPLSLLNLVVIKNIPQYLIYPLQLINVFELLYWIVLAYLIGIYTNKSFDKSFGFVAKTYGVGLFAWVVLVVFLSIN